MEGEQIQEQIVPENVVESDTGDWGTGALELEQELLENIKEPESTEEGSPATPEVVAEPIAQEPEGPLFDIDGKLSVKAGQPLSADHVKELERGWLRERDYTQKTQQVAEVRQAAEQVLQASERINQDPKALRDYFPAEHILQAFDKREMLNYGLSAAGVPPQMWNQFLEWYKEAGFAPEQATQNLAADPYVQQFGALKQEISTLGKTVQQLQAERQHAEVQSREAAQKQAYDNEMNRIGSEVDQALAKYPDVEKEDLLVEMARSDGSLSVAELAKKVQGRYEARYNAYVEKKKQTKLTAPKPLKGQTVKIEQRAPKTFAEADEMLDRVYGTGSLKQRG